MPLSEVHDTVSLRNGKTRFLIFFSSRLNGRLWCPDCVTVESLVNEVFGSEESPPAALVYVGQKEEWKAKENVFRGEPWNLTAIPTIIKLGDDGEEIDRLVEGDLADQTKLTRFLQPPFIRRSETGPGDGGDTGR